MSDEQQGKRRKVVLPPVDAVLGTPRNTAREEEAPVEAVRASMGAIFTQKIVQCRWDEFITWLRAGDGQLVGTSLQTDMDYQAARYSSPCFILTGNEAQGLPDDYEGQCDLLVKMPMQGKADSLNAAVATAVMAYEVLNQFRRPVRD